MDGDIERDDYDEFRFLEYHAGWAGIPWSGPPVVTRGRRTGHGHELGFLRWGSAEPDLVLLHGAGQNAHLWDTFMLARTSRGAGSAVAVDLPGHGWSDWRADGDYSPEANAVAVAEVVAEVAPRARAVVGFSLGGLTAIRLAAARPDLVRGLVVVDITPAAPFPDRPATGPANLGGGLALMGGPRRFDSWTDVLDAARRVLPHRSVDSLVPGLRHNVRRDRDGSWGWRYDRLYRDGARPPDHAHQWAEVAALGVPAMFLRGGASAAVSPAAWDELARLAPAVRREVVAGCGHSVPGERPVELADLVDGFLTTGPQPATANPRDGTTR